MTSNISSKENSKNAFVTLLTSDSYLAGALVLAKSLRSTKTPYPIIVLVTPESVSTQCVQILYKTFDQVVFVPVIKSNQMLQLSLLGRKELDITFTKMHAWNPDLIAYDRIVFLDADVLILENVDSLFEYVDGDVAFAAAPDVGWPDCFNSGVFVTKPGKPLFDALIAHSITTGSFDGGDQGLLNSFFSSWSGHRDVDNPKIPKSVRLPFTYNVTPTAFYSYLPAFVHFNPTIMCVHFIGETKPWYWERFADGGIVPRGSASSHTLQLIRKWWDLFDAFGLHKLLGKLPNSSVNWKNYKAPEQETIGFVPNDTYRSSLNDLRPTQTPSDLLDYRISWNPQEVYRPPTRAKSPVKRHARPPTSPTKRNSGSQSSSIPVSPSTSELGGYKVGWNPLELHTPRSRSKSPEKRILTDASPSSSSASYFDHTGEIMSRHTSQESPAPELGDYKVGWNENEIKAVQRRTSSDNKTLKSPGEVTMDKEESSSTSPKASALGIILSPTKAKPLPRRSTRDTI